MDKKQRIINLAYRTISNNNNETNKVNVIAIIERGGKILSIGENNMVKSHTCYHNGEHNKAIHAEYAAINKIEDTNNSNIYVFRFLKSGDLGISKPCSYCMAMIVGSRIRTVTYYDGASIKTEKVVWQN